MRYIIFFTLLSSAGFVPCNSQTVNGHWYGVGKVQLSGSHNQYLTELVLRQNKKKIKGEMLYYFRDSLFTQNIEGSYDSASRKLLLNKLPIIFYASNDLQNSIDCDMMGTFTLRISKAESLLIGNFSGDEDHKYTTPPINFTLTKSNDTALLVSMKKNDNLNETEELLPKTPVTIAFEQRAKKLTKEIEVKSSTIQLELFDNGEIDNDSVSVFVNNKMVLEKTMLSNNAIKLTLQLDSTAEYTDVCMFANNLGKIPPNTAALILYDGATRYEIQMSSNLKETATIRLRKKQ